MATARATRRKKCAINTHEAQAVNLELQSLICAYVLPISVDFKHRPRAIRNQSNRHLGFVYLRVVKCAEMIHEFLEENYFLNHKRYVWKITDRNVTLRDGKGRFVAIEPIYQILCEWSMDNMPNSPEVEEAIERCAQEIQEDIDAEVLADLRRIAEEVLN